MFDAEVVKGSEFLRKVRRLADRRGLACRWVPTHGVGSHGTLYVGSRLTVLKYLTKEIGPGLLSDMCKQLGIDRKEL